jgi:hypothetical protein
MPLLPLLADTAIASYPRARRESPDFTLKRNRAERVQIVNGQRAPCHAANNVTQPTKRGLTI